MPEKFDWMEESTRKDYLYRTEWNVVHSDATLVLAFGTELAGGRKRTVEFCKKHNKPYWVEDLNAPRETDRGLGVLYWLETLGVSIVLNAAGPRESRSPGIQRAAREYVKMLVGLIGVVFAPSVLYPFLWLSPICAFVLIDTFFGLPTGLEPLRDGNWSQVWRWAVAMLLCGFIWETWGFWIEVRWVYTVPYLHRFCYAEMPLIGFAGYLPFGIEAFLVCRSLSISSLRAGVAVTD